MKQCVSNPLGTSHRALPPELQAKIGINKGVVRISIGIEDARDIINQFEKAIELPLKKLFKKLLTYYFILFYNAH
jgi:O-acetylhomoserine/O-acetylserine sulfhydrylase-like pyridoxal-dependent enzyme